MSETPQACGLQGSCATGDCVRSALIRLVVVALALCTVALATGQMAWLLLAGLLLFTAAVLWLLDRPPLKRKASSGSGEAAHG